MLQALEAWQLADPARAARFGSWTELAPLWPEALSSLRPFFADDEATRRMDELRRSIVQIRRRWDRYDEYAALVREITTQGGLTAHGASEVTERMSRLLARRRDWIDREGADREAAEDYSAVRLYTSQPGYEHIFSVVNRVFRAESADLGAAITAAVFLVELLNIDLYNCCRLDPAAADFEGVVYRGMCATRSEFESFVRLLTRPAASRYFSIPLGLLSASLRQDEARAFIARTVAHDPSSVPILWKIHVAGLSPELIAAYRVRFPRSVVSTICAVPIHQLSEFPHEREVLLRGPFFQALGLREDPNADTKIGECPVHVFELLMLTGNRDHFSTAELGEEDAPARELFGQIARVRRYKLCVEHARANGSPDDASEYQSELDEAQRQLDGLLARSS